MECSKSEASLGYIKTQYKKILQRNQKPEIMTQQFGRQRQAEGLQVKPGTSRTTQREFGASWGYIMYPHTHTPQKTGKNGLTPEE